LLTRQCVVAGAGGPAFDDATTVGERTLALRSLRFDMVKLRTLGVGSRSRCDERDAGSARVVTDTAARWKRPTK
jgi:hypothetical protein